MDRYPNTANALPVVTICQLLLANLSAAHQSARGGSKATTTDAAAADSRAANVYRLAMCLAECLE